MFERALRFVIPLCYNLSERIVRRPIMNLIGALLAAAFVGFVIGVTPASAQAGSQTHVSPADKIQDVSSDRRRRREARRTVHEEKPIDPRACEAVVFPRSPACGPRSFFERLTYPFWYPYR